MDDRNEALNLERAATSAVCIVPARLGSQRLARKAMADLGGAPLIVRVCENIERADVFGRILVACDSREVVSAVAAAGFEAVMTAAELASGTDRVAACAKTYGLGDDALIVNVQGDEPFVGAQTLRAVVEALRVAGPRTIVTARESIRDEADLADPNLVKVATGEHDRALYFSRAPIPYVRDRNPGQSLLAPQHYRHVGVYAYRGGTLERIAALPPHPLERLEQLEQLRWLAHGYRMQAVLVAPGHRGVDTGADLAAANAHYRKMHS